LETRVQIIEKYGIETEGGVKFMGGRGEKKYFEESKKG
jgi:hypothetical protein